MFLLFLQPEWWLLEAIHGFFLEMNCFNAKSYRTLPSMERLRITRATPVSRKHYENTSTNNR